MTPLARTRRLLFHNLGLKILSLAIAMAVWWGVARDPVVEIPITTSVEFHHVPDGLEISSESIPQAQIRVRGPARVIRELARTDIHPIIDLQGSTPGERTFDLTPRQVQLPHEIEIIQIVPAQLRVNIDRREQREVEVRPRVLGTFASGYRISETSVAPTRLTIVGPAHRVRSIENAITDPVDATGVIGRATFTTNAYIPDPLVRVVNPEPIKVTVVTEKTNTRAGIP